MIFRGGGKKNDYFQHHIKYTFTRIFSAKENSTEVPIREGAVKAVYSWDGATHSEGGKSSSLGISMTTSTAWNQAELLRVSV